MLNRGPSNNDRIDLPGRVLDQLLAFLAALAGLLLLFVTFSISYTILARFVGFASPVWVVQFNEYALLWMTFLGTAWLLTKDKHVSIDLVTRLLPVFGRVILSLLHNAVGAILCAVFTWYGTLVTWDQFQRGVTDVQAIDFPKYLVLAVIPLGFFLLAVQFLRRFISILRKSQDGNHHARTALNSDAAIDSDKKAAVANRGRR
jgi:TRAP-type C4-dicarboxylate transport system permease small subunit